MAINSQYSNFLIILEFIMKENGKMENKTEEVPLGELMVPILKPISKMVKLKERAFMFTQTDLITMVNSKTGNLMEKEDSFINLIK